MIPFRLLRAFNDEKVRGYAGAKARIGRNSLPYFQGEGRVDRLVRELAHERALPIKEVVEAFEFFGVTRRYLREPVIADLCSGHGLAGILFAVFERRTERVLLCDRRRPQNFEDVWRAVIRAAPWIADKVQYVEGAIEKTSASLEPGTAVLGLHACGRLTDTCLETAVRLGGSVAVMPCCRSHRLTTAPPGIREALGGDLAYDIDRTYAMEARSYRVRWREIPEEITPMNRILIAVPRRQEAQTGAPVAPGA